MLDWLRDLWDWLLAADEWRTTRLAVAAIAALVAWRAIYIWSQSPPTPPREPAEHTAAPAPSTPAPRRWFPTRQQKLENAINEVRLQTAHCLAQADATKASASLAQARAQLAGLLRDLQPAAAPAPEKSIPTLSLQEILDLIDLANIDHDSAARLRALVTGAIEEKS